MRPRNGRGNTCWTEKRFEFGAPGRVHVKIYSRLYKYRRAKPYCLPLWRRIPGRLFAADDVESIRPPAIVVWMTAADPIR